MNTGTHLQLHYFFRNTARLTCAPAILLACCTASGGEVAGRMVLGQGHLDIDFDYTAEAGWTLRHRHEDEGIRALDEGLLFARDGLFPAEGSRIARPEGEEWSFLGVEAGEPLWFLPVNERPEILWPGFAAEHTDAAALAPWEANDPRRTAQAMRWIAVDLLETRFTGHGTGHVALWEPDTFGGPPVVLWSTAAPHPAGNRYLMAAGSHNHMAWGFSATGVYELDVRASTVLADGSTSASGVETLVFVVGGAPDPPRFGEWAALRFTPTERAAGLAKHDADPFASGVPNLLAFVSGNEPGTRPAAAAPRLTATDGTITATFTRRADLGDTVLYLERSRNLGDWETAARTTGQDSWETMAEESAVVSEAAADAGVREVTVTFTEAPFFLRSRAALEP